MCIVSWPSENIPFLFSTVSPRKEKKNFLPIRFYWRDFLPPFLLLHFLTDGGRLLPYTLINEPARADELLLADRISSFFPEATKSTNFLFFFFFFFFYRTIFSPATIAAADGLVVQSAVIH